MKYSIGIDFGTLSARGILVDVQTGAVVESIVYVYPDGVITECLPGTQIKVPQYGALHNPKDYIDALKEILCNLWRKAGVDSANIIGIGVDATSSTVLPVNRDFMPLCFEDKYQDNPHSWMKIWKHHSAQNQADRMLDVACDRNEQFLKRSGGQISAEWMMPKVLETLCEAPEIYFAAYRFIEAADWIVYLLTGEECRNSCMAGFKSMWSKRSGYPSNDYYKAVDDRFENVIEDKIGKDVSAIGTKAGTLTSEFVRLTGLEKETSVAVANTDGHLAHPAVGALKAHQMVLIMGTSICQMLVDHREVEVKGISGVSEDGILPGFFGYETGQPGVGDLFEWYIRCMMPSAYTMEAKKHKKSLYEWMEYKAGKIAPGQSGLVALDWINGNRSILSDMNLSGLLAGITLETKPEDIYRTFLEATSFGTRTIIENYRDAGLPVKELFACGGLSIRNNLLMQIFADVLDMEIKISETQETPALGAAMYAACAAGSESGGYDNIFEASTHMSRIKKESYLPNSAHHGIYNELFGLYKDIHNSFGREYHAGFMKDLKDIRLRAISNIQK